MRVTTLSGLWRTTPLTGLTMNEDEVLAGLTAHEGVILGGLASEDDSPHGAYYERGPCGAHYKRLRPLGSHGEAF